MSLHLDDKPLFLKPIKQRFCYACLFWVCNFFSNLVRTICSRFLVTKEDLKLKKDFNFFLEDKRGRMSLIVT